MMRGAVPTILDAIGHTPLVKLHRLARDVQADVYVKCEYLNPAGSAKDRMTKYLVEQAEQRGELKPGGTIVEATGGNAGAGLAMIAAARGYKCVLVVPDKTSAEKIAGLRAYGAKVVVCPTAVEPGDARSAYSVARRLAGELPGAFYANQHASPDNPLAHYASTGPELFEQTGGELDVLVSGLGTGGTLTGAGRYLKERKPGIKVVGVDPIGSLYYDLVKSGRPGKAVPYKVEDLGTDVVAPALDPGVLDDVVQVDDGACFLTCRELVREEGLFVGGSSGAAVAGALAYARATNRRENIVVVLPDGAGNYLSKIFSDDWMRENGFLAAAPGLGTVADVLRGKTGEVIVARSSDRVRDVIARMKAHGISQLPIVDDGALRGAVAEVDLLRYLVSGESSLESAVGPLVESEYATVALDTKVEHLQGVLSEARMALVLDAERIVGVVTKIDLIDFLARRTTGA